MSRLYNKFYMNKNREEGSEKILMGYQYDEKELVLKADQETHFHIPYYTSPVFLKDTSLVINGATGGSFPAASDRIFKNRKNFGNTTPYGTPQSDIADGVWFCSWLYKDPGGGLRWIDRFYNPGSFKFSLAVQQLGEGPSYEINNPVFRDIPSRMVLEPGVMYRYFHVGEKTSQFLVTTFGGLTGERILMDLSEWGSEQVDVSNNKITPKVFTNISQSELYRTYQEPGRVDKKVIDLDNNSATEIIIDYSPSYNPLNEFTLSFWAQSPDWNQVQTTQIVGNHTSSGGYGLYVQNLSSFPFFVFQETNYGHILYLNERGLGYLDKSAQIVPRINANPKFVNIDFDQNVLVCNQDNSGLFYKLDNAGKVIASSRETFIPFQYINSNEVPQQVICGPNNTTVIITQSTIYTLDDQLNKTEQFPQKLFPNSIAAYRYDIQNDTYELDVTPDVLDSKFIEQTQWFISASDQNLYRKVGSTQAELFYIFPNKATNFAIDPQNRLWVLHGNNDLTILDSFGDPFDEPILSTDVGFNVAHQQKQITFYCYFDRATNSREWRSIIYYSDEPFIYILDLDVNPIQTISIFSLFNKSLIETLGQSYNDLQFLGVGDITGYEHRRVFGQLSPYKNNSQLVLKCSLKDNTKQELYYSQFKTQTPINQWDLNSWQHIVITLRNKVFTVYVNGQTVMSLAYSGRYQLSYELQPLFFIGSSPGSQSGFNQEIQNTSTIFNGLIGDIKIYDYALNEDKIELFSRADLEASDLFWFVPIPLIQYVEKVERMFKNKMPGSKSPFYKIKIRGTQVTDLQTRELINQQIETIAEELQPSYTDFLEVVWVD